MFIKLEIIKQILMYIWRILSKKTDTILTYNALFMIVTELK